MLLFFVDAFSFLFDNGAQVAEFGGVPCSGNTVQQGALDLTLGAAVKTDLFAHSVSLFLLVVTSASLLVTSALLLVTRSH